jgi:hypothetical protein
MIACRAIFLAGVTGDAIAQYRGVLSHDDLHHFRMRAIAIELQVLALHQAVHPRTGGAKVGVEL